MKLSKRLRAVADMVTPDFILADIGTDHAYIPIYLVENRIIPRAYAMDVNRGPLARAAEHIREHGLTEQIETRLSDGLAALQSGEAQSVVIAGMGGALTIRILQKGEKLLHGSQSSLCAEKSRSGAQAEPRSIFIQELILQPQSEVPQVRAYLEKAGFSIVREDMVFEDGKYYPMMKAVRSGAETFFAAHSAAERVRHGENAACLAAERIRHGENAACLADDAADTQAVHVQISRETQMLFGPELLRMRHPVLHRYLLRERAAQERILEVLEQNAGASADANNEAQSSRAKQRMAEIRHEIRLIDEALAFFSEEKGQVKTERS